MESPNRISSRRLFAGQPRARSPPSRRSAPYRAEPYSRTRIPPSSHKSIQHTELAKSYRSYTCPFLLPVVVKPEDPSLGEEDEEYQIYAWMGDTLRDIVNLMKDVHAAARKPKCKLILKRRSLASKEVTELGVLNGTYQANSDRKTLRSARFQIGDTIELIITQASTPTHNRYRGDVDDIAAENEDVEPDDTEVLRRESIDADLPTEGEVLDQPNDQDASPQTLSPQKLTEAVEHQNTPDRSHLPAPTPETSVQNRDIEVEKSADKERDDSEETKADIEEEADTLGVSAETAETAAGAVEDAVMEPAKGSQLEDARESDERLLGD